MRRLICWLLWMSLVGWAWGQQVSSSSGTVPTVIRFSGNLAETNGKPLSGVVGVTFSLYRDEQGGAPLWVETQNVQADKSGHCTVTLGSTTPQGLPQGIFALGEARWLGVQPQGQPEQPRVLLLSVPYALKAGDSETVGGLPPSAFVLATPANSGSSTPPTLDLNSILNPPALGGSGKKNYLPIWTNSTTLGNSVLFQAGKGAKAQVGIGTTTPASTLDVNGGGTVRGLFTLPATGTATAAAGFNSQPMDLAASVFNSGTSTAVPQIFQWQAEPVGNNTSTASGSLNLLFAQGSGKPAETGLNIASNGQIAFAKGQTFPGAGTVTSVGSGLGLTGGPVTSTGALSIDTSVVPQLGTGNNFTGNQAVNGNVSASQLISTVAPGTAPLNVTSTTQVPNLNASLLDGFSASAFQVAGTYATLGANQFTATQTVTSGDVSVSNGNLDLPATSSASSGVMNLGGIPFIHACCSNSGKNIFAGLNAGNFTTTGVNNVALGFGALNANTKGSFNTAVGHDALVSNTSGGRNTAIGIGALELSTTAAFNTATGEGALGQTTGNSNTAVGDLAGLTNTAGTQNTFLGATADAGSGSLTNATAIGANAQVTASNAMVLGSIAGVNGASANTNVGIGTTAPASALDVHGTGNFTGLVTFAAGQSFPGTVGSVTAGTDLTNTGTSSNPILNVDTTKVVTAVVGGTDLTGGGTGGVQTLNLDTTKVPLLGANNSFTGNQSVTGDVKATGTVAGGVVNAATSFNLGGTVFAFGSYGAENAFVGFAGNPSTTGTANTAIGENALLHNVAGSVNTAIGLDALYLNTAGTDNTATGFGALANGTIGNYNVAYGEAALLQTNGNYNTGLGYNTGWVGGNFLTGSNNTFVGSSANFGPQFNINNATAIGANAQVTASNALVLGSINGVNSATADTNVGIGTTAPSSPLTVVTSSTYLPALLQSSSGFGTWMELNNTSTGGKNWAILSAGGANAEGAGNLGITNFTGTSTIYLEGNVNVTGNLSKGGGSFKIDHPLDPANKYLSHSFVESPDMMNIYNGVAALDAHGAVWITMPEYFEALNRDFRYQLTSMGRPQPSLYVAREISGNRFKIGGGKPWGRVSWQVTGVRQDAYANAHRIPVEEEKSPQEQGHYLHPELFGATQQEAIGVRAPSAAMLVEPRTAVSFLAQEKQ